MIFLLVAAAVVVGAPIIAAMLVTVASLHEDSAHSLGGRALAPPGPIGGLPSGSDCWRPKLHGDGILAEPPGPGQPTYPGTSVCRR